jgi:hypothetical protein
MGRSAFERPGQGSLVEDAAAVAVAWSRALNRARCGAAVCPWVGASS